MREVLRGSAPPREQESWRDPVPAGGLRCSPRPFKALGHDPPLLGFRPTTAPAGRNHIEPLNTVRMTFHTHTTLRRPHHAQDGPRRRLTCVLPFRTHLRRHPPEAAMHRENFGSLPSRPPNDRGKPDWAHPQLRRRRAMNKQAAFSGV